MASEDGVLPVDQQGIGEPEALNAVGDLTDLLAGMSAGIAYPGAQPIQRKGIPNNHMHALSGDEVQSFVEDTSTTLRLWISVASRQGVRRFPGEDGVEDELVGASVSEYSGASISSSITHPRSHTPAAHIHCITLPRVAAGPAFVVTHEEPPLWDICLD
jgi:hypothetical protein